MQKLPQTTKALLLRTDFSNDATWDALCEAVQAPTEKGFQAMLDCISDPVYDRFTAEQLTNLSAAGGDRTFAFIADQLTHSDSERPVLVVDLYDDPGRTFRVVPREIWGVENNLSIANMDFGDFADNVDNDGVFRGFPRQ